MKKYVKCSTDAEEFLEYHEDYQNYRHQQDNFDAVYEILNDYARSDENPEDMGVDVLFERASDADKAKMISLINPANWQ